MGNDRWSEVRRLFEAALEVEPGERSGWLVVHCADEAMRAEVEQLLAADSSETSDIGILDLGAIPAAALRGSGEAMVGMQVGAFKVRRVIGSGGMGTVFEAEQDRPRRTVALKMLRYAFAGERSRRRFEYEAEILGRLQHPGIAQVYEAGTLLQGGLDQPYFAMELIPGARTLDSYVREEGLDQGAVLRLFGRICEAVHYAHQRGVIHRDLKPANVLVDDQGQPKVIDFGIARATGADLERVTLQTETGQIVGTLAYMSPEQLDADTGGQDIRVDVYALGVILFELLTGRVPFQLTGLPLGAATDLLRNQPVPRPSTAVMARRGTIPAELDWIAMRAMAKEPDMRYASAWELAADLERHRRGEPVSAGPPSTAYRLRKFVQRNRLAVSAAVVVALTLVVGTIATSLGWSRALRAEVFAQERRQQAMEMAGTLWQVTTLQSEILASAGGDRNVRFVDLIDRARERLARSSIQDPNVLAALNNALGNSYRTLGMAPQARQHLEKARALLESTPTPFRGLKLIVSGNLGGLLTELGELAEGEAMLRAALAGHEEAFALDDVKTAKVRVQLANALIEGSKVSEGLAHYEQALGVLRSELGEMDPAVLSTLTGYGSALQAAGRLVEAEETVGLAYRTAREHLGAEDVETLSIQNTLAALLLAAEKHPEAEAHLQELSEVRARISGESHPSTLRVLNNLAVCFERQHKYPEAVTIYRRVMDVRRRSGGGSTLFDLVTRFNLAVALHFQNDEARVREASDELEALLPEAEKLLPADNWRLAVFRVHYGTCLRKRGLHGPAETALEQACTVLEAALGADNGRTQSCYAEFVALYEAWNKPERAAEFRDKLPKKQRP